MKLHHFFAIALLALILFATFVASHPNNITAHEWGTFTSIAGPNGLAMDWLPLSGPTDLPPFVEHLQNTQFKGGLSGTVRMETPVLYFYSPQETSVSVHVSFNQGLITEWYPHGEVPALNPRRDVTLQQKRTEGAITWANIQIQPAAPADFPANASAGHYFAARQTTSAPLSIETPAGTQHEKFLFYRGVSAILPPLTAMLAPDSTVALQNHLPSPIPNAILFERRGNQLGYRILGPITDQAAFAPPTLDGNLDSLFSAIEGLLVAQGLFADEAHAMLETWKDSWFEEGSRILYLVPRAYVDSVLPITINPTPNQLTRVFVGRLELITPATQNSVLAAFANNDQSTLAKYNRFLDPILRSMLEKAHDQPTRDQLTAYLDSAYTSYYSRQSQN
jgi:hypothetical protein